MVELKDWVEYLKSKELSETTIKNYYFYYKKFNWDKLGQAEIISFVNKYKNDVFRAFIKNTLQFLLFSDLPESYKAKIRVLELPKITGRKKKREDKIVSKDDVHLISNAMSCERNKIMVLLNFYCGLRVTELINIRPYDFNWRDWLKNVDHRCKLYVIGKGNKQRTVFVPAELMKIMYKWIKECVSTKQDKDIPIFKIKVRRYQILLDKASEKAIQRKIHPHILRSSCATYLLEKGLNIKEIAVYLGHESISTTQRYTQINKENLGNKVEKAFN